MRRVYKGRQQPEPYKIAEAVEPRPLTSRQRTGRAFLIDTFENYTTAVTEKWAQDTGTVALDTAYPKEGKRCMKLTTGTAATNNARATIYVGGVPKGKMGIELDFMTMDVDDNITSLCFSSVVYDGTNAVQYGLKYLGSTDLKWQYMNTSGTYTDVTGGAHTLQISETVPIWQHFKAIYDSRAAEYVKFYCNEKEFSLAGIDAYSSANAAAAYESLTIEIVNETSTAARNLYIDNFILTELEP